MSDPNPNPSGEVRVRFDAARGDSVLDLAISPSRASALIAAVQEAVRPLHAAIQYLTLRPRRGVLDAHIVVSSDRARRDSGAQSALIGAVLEAIQGASAEPVAA